MVETTIAVVAALVLASVAFRRARGVLTPEGRREVARQGLRNRTRRAALAGLTVARVAVGVAALIGIVWLTRQLFT